MALPPYDIDTKSRSIFHLVPPGLLIMYAGIEIPDGYLECNGQSLNTKTYTELFSVIGYTFGGSNQTFNVPNLGSLFIRGSSMNKTIGYLEDDQILEHEHIISSTNEFVFDFQQLGLVLASRGGDILNRPEIVNVDDSFSTTESEGLSSSESRPKNVSIRHIIKFRRK